MDMLRSLHLLLCTLDATSSGMSSTPQVSFLSRSSFPFSSSFENASPSSSLPSSFSFSFHHLKHRFHLIEMCHNNRQDFRTFCHVIIFVIIITSLIIVFISLNCFHHNHQAFLSLFTIFSSSVSILLFFKNLDIVVFQWKASHHQAPFTSFSFVNSSS